jgi:hypothetical protein
VQLETGSVATSRIPTTSAPVTRAADVVGATGLIHSTVPETEYAAYNAGANYLVGDRAIYLHKTWESVQTPNIGHTPDTNPLYWAQIAPSNRWAMFDSAVGTVTSVALRCWS